MKIRERLAGFREVHWSKWRWIRTNESMIVVKKTEVWFERTLFAKAQAESIANELRFFNKVETKVVEIWRTKRKPAERIPSLKADKSKYGGKK